MPTRSLARDRSNGTRGPPEPVRPPAGRGIRVEMTRAGHVAPRTALHHLLCAKRSCRSEFPCLSATGAVLQWVTLAFISPLCQKQSMPQGRETPRPGDPLTNSRAGLPCAFPGAPFWNRELTGEEQVF